MGTIVDDGVKLLIVLAVCLMVFGPQRLPEVARQLGGFIARVRKFTEDALEQIRQETDLKDLNLPDLRVGSLRSQATQYVRDLIDVDGQVAELRRAASVDELRAQTSIDVRGMLRPGGRAPQPGTGDTAVAVPAMAGGATAASGPAGSGTEAGAGEPGAASAGEMAPAVAPPVATILDDGADSGSLTLAPAGYAGGAATLPPVDPDAT